MDLRNQMERERLELIATEDALQFDPARNDADFQILSQLQDAVSGKHD